MEDTVEIKCQSTRALRRDTPLHASVTPVGHTVNLSPRIALLKELVRL